MTLFSCPASLYPAGKVKKPFAQSQILTIPKIANSPSTVKVIVTACRSAQEANRVLLPVNDSRTEFAQSEISIATKTKPIGFRCHAFGNMSMAIDATDLVMPHVGHG
jgi:hypothetical protein